MGVSWNIGEEVQEPEVPPEGSDQHVQEQYAKDKEAYDKYQHKYKLKLWYVDSYLTAAAGSEWWSATIKPYHLPTDTYDEAGEKVLVPSAAEAFGLVQFEDSRNRWLNCFKWKKANPGKGKKPPTWSKKRDAQTIDFKCLWSDYSHGQGSGWDPEAYKTYKKRLADIKKFRSEEAQETPSYPKFREGQAMIKIQYDIPVEQTEPPNKKKRKLEVEIEEDEDEDSDMEDEIEVEEE